VDEVTSVVHAPTPDGRVFALDQQTMISIGIQLFNAVLLAVVLSKILYKPVQNFLKKRTDRISAQMGRIEVELTKVNELKAQYEKKLEEIETERSEVLESAHRVAMQKNKQLLAEVQKEVSAIRERAASDIQVERKRANEDIKFEIIDIASVISEKFITQSMDADTQDRLFYEALAELGNDSWQD